MKPNVPPIDVTLSDLDWHRKELLSKVHVDMLVTGNVTEAVRRCRKTIIVRFAEKRYLILTTGSS